MEVQQTTNRLKNILLEFTDGAVLIGFTAGGEPVVVSHVPDAKTAISLNAIMGTILAQGGVQFVTGQEGSE